MTGLGIDRRYFQRTDCFGSSSCITDALRSTLALANSAGALATSYTYDPVGGALAGCACGGAAGSFVAAVGAGLGCIAGMPVGIGVFVYMGYRAASRGTLPQPQEDLARGQSGLP